MFSTNSSRWTFREELEKVPCRSGSRTSCGSPARQEPQSTAGWRRHHFQSTFNRGRKQNVDRADLERKGIKWEDMEPHLKAMSYGHKLNKMVEMNPEMEPGGMRVPKGRISLEEQPDGSIKAIPHYHQEKPNLDAPLHGTKASMMKSQSTDNGQCRKNWLNWN